MDNVIFDPELEDFETIPIKDIQVGDYIEVRGFEESKSEASPVQKVLAIKETTLHNGSKFKWYKVAIGGWVCHAWWKGSPRPNPQVCSECGRAK